MFTKQLGQTSKLGQPPKCIFEVVLDHERYSYLETPLVVVELWYTCTYTRSMRFLHEDEMDWL